MVYSSYARKAGILQFGPDEPGIQNLDAKAAVLFTILNGIINLSNILIDLYNYFTDITATLGIFISFFVLGKWKYFVDCDLQPGIHGAD
jgi:hypothetical protein